MLNRAITDIAGRPVDECRLSAGNIEVALLSYGAITSRLVVNGRSIILGYDDLRAYETDPYYLGAIAGRVANRITASQFTLDGTRVELLRNEGANHLHGGPRGLSKRHWTMEEDSAANAVRLTHVSGHGDGGYPGRAAFEVTISVTNSQLIYDMRAEVDRPTPINMAQHNYYNLTGGTVWNHSLMIAADEYLVVDEQLLPTGARHPVEGTSHDFRTMRSLEESDPAHDGIDSCLILTGGQPAAVLTAPSAPQLRFHTDQPGLQLYTGGALGNAEGPDNGLLPFTGICLEPEGFPDAVNHPEFPSIIVDPDAPYHQRLTIEID